MPLCPSHAGTESSYGSHWCIKTKTSNSNYISILKWLLLSVKEMDFCKAEVRPLLSVEVSTAGWTNIEHRRKKETQKRGKGGGGEGGRKGGDRDILGRGRGRGKEKRG